MQNDIGLELLAKFLADECNDSEKEIVLNWIETDPLNRDEFNYIKSIWNASGDKHVNWDVEKAWDKFSVNSGIKEDLPVTKNRPKNSIKLFSFGKIVPAISVILILLASVFYFNTISIEPLPSKKIEVINAFHKITTEKGQRVSFKLPDGSEVFLNAASSIQFPADFLNGKREISLDGEAFFRVVHKDDEPFIVSFKNGIVQDIGTEFNIKSWKDDKSSSIAVSSGEVAVKSNDIDKSVRLMKGQFTIIPENGLPSVPVKARIDHLTGWMYGKLYFDNTMLGDVFKSLSRSYNLDCTISDSLLLSLHLTAGFGEETPEEIIHIISLALDLKHKKSGNKIYFYPGKNFYFNKTNKVQDLN